MKASYKESRKIGILGWLIIIEVAAFVMQNLMWLFLRDDVYHNAILGFFALSGSAIANGKVWTLISYGFLHDTNNIFHILFNMLGLFFIGRIVTKLFGERVLLHTFLLSTFTGGLLYILFHLNSNGIVLGASGALMGVIALFCLARPEEEVTMLLYFIIPVTLKPKWILWGLSAISILGLLFREIPGASYTAHSAHMGGILGGYLYFKFFIQRGSKQKISSKFAFKKPNVTPPRKTKVKNVSYSVNFGNKEKLKKEVDRILDKINDKGFGALTPEERTTLDRARDILNS